MHAAAPDVPGPLIAALKPGGRLVLPLAVRRADVLTVFRRADDDSEGDVKLERTVIAECRFVPLLGESGFPSRDR